MKKLMVFVLLSGSLLACGDNGVSVNVTRDSSSKRSGFHVDVKRDSLDHKLDTLQKRMDTLGNRIDRKAEQIWDSTKAKTDRLRKKI